MMTYPGNAVICQPGGKALIKASKTWVAVIGTLSYGHLGGEVVRVLSPLIFVAEYIGKRLFQDG